MLCEKCKTREANIRYTEVRNGIRTDHNLCAQCAKEMDFGHSGVFDIDNPIGKLLSDLFGLEPEGDVPDEIEGSKVICPTCHTAYSDFLKDSRFGCPDCYRVFDLLMDDNIKKLQGSDIHKGKRPKNSSVANEMTAEEISGREESAAEKIPEEEIPAEEQIEILKAKLAEALEAEEYEKAAEYRDEIRALKEKISAEA